MQPFVNATTRPDSEFMGEGEEGEGEEEGEEEANGEEGKGKASTPDRKPSAAAVEARRSSEVSAWKASMESEAAMLADAPFGERLLQVC
jgi:hypothetical protein